MLMFLFKLILGILAFLEAIAAALHFFDRSRETRKHHSSRKYLEAGLQDLVANVASLFFLPWATWHQRASQWVFKPEGGPPICLVSGHFFGFGPCLYGLYAKLRARGAQNIFILSLPYSRGSVDRMGEKLEESLARINRCTGGKKPLLVAHGIAGLAARMGQTKSLGHYTRGVVTVATPHHGTRLAVFIPGPLGFQLEPGSPMLAALDAEPLDFTLTFRAEMDTQIIPSESASFGQRVRELPRTSHLSILWNPEVCAAILDEVSHQAGEQAPTVST